MESEYDLKGFRILKIYSDLLEGKVLKKKEYAECVDSLKGAR